MRIIFLHFYSSTPVPSYRMIASGLRARGDEVMIGTPNDTGNFEIVDGESRVALIRGPIELPRRLQRIPLLSLIFRQILFLPFLLRVKKFLNSSHFDIVQVNPSSCYWVGILPLFRPRKSNFILDFRQISLPKTKNPLRMIKNKGEYWANTFNAKRIYQRACFVYPIAAEYQLGAQWRKWANVVPHGVYPGFVEQSMPQPTSKSSVIDFVYIGTLSKIRKLEQILFAVGKALDTSSRIRTTFIGPDLESGHYQKLAKTLKLDIYVKFMPPLPYEELPEVLSNFDVALAYTPEKPLDWHIQPTLKVLEYRALGMPILATDTPPNLDLVEQGVNGLLADNSVESLSRGMLRFVLDPDFLRQCYESAQERRNVRTWGEVAEMYATEIYEPLVYKSEA
jgi:glycosyltransferase involved in cell wall biosynthesis